MVNPLIVVTQENKDELYDIAVKGEFYNDVITKLLKFYKENGGGNE